MKNLTDRIGILIKSNDYVYGIVICTLVTAIFFAKYLIPGQSFSAADILFRNDPWQSEVNQETYNPLRTDDIYLNHPSQQNIYEQSREGNIVTFTDKKLSGEVQYGFTYYFSPFLIPYLVLPPIDATIVSLILRVFVALLGVFILVRTLGKSRLAGIVAGVVFVGSSQFFSWINTPITTTFALFPWALILVLYIIKSNFQKKLKYTLLLGLVIGMSIIPGHFPSNIIFIAITGLFLIAHLLKLVIVRAKFNTSLFLREIQSLVFFSFSIILGLLYSLVSLYPFVEKTLNSQLLTRGGDSGSMAFINLTLTGALSTLISPNILGNPVDGNWGYRGNYNEYVFYFGLISIILILVSFKKLLKNHTDRINLIFFIVGLGMVLGIPPFNFISNIFGFKQIPPQRWGIIISFFGGLLSAGAVDNLLMLKSFKFKLGNNLKKILIILTPISILLVGLLAYLFRNQLIRYSSSGKLLYIAINLIIEVTIVILVVLTLILISKYKKNLLKLLLILILLLGNITWIWHFHPSLERSLVFPKTPGLKYLSEIQGDSRVMFLNGGRFNVNGNVQEAYGIRGINGYDLFIDKNYQDYIHALCLSYDSEYNSFLGVSEDNCLKSPLLDMLGVRYIAMEHSRSISNDKFVKIYSGIDMDIYENPDARQAWFIKQRSVTSGNIYEKINQNISNYLDIGYGNKSEEFKECGSQVLDQERQNEVIKLSIIANCDSYLIVNEKYELGWKVFVDGKETQAEKINGIFVGIHIPEGSRDIELKFNSDKYIELIKVSSVTLIISLLLIAILSRSKYMKSQSNLTA